MNPQQTQLPYPDQDFLDSIDPIPGSALRPNESRPEEEQQCSFDEIDAMDGIQFELFIKYLSERGAFSDDCTTPDMPDREAAPCAAPNATYDLAGGSLWPSASKGGKMPFCPTLSSPPTIDELRAYHEWLSKPHEMKSAPPPLPPRADARSAPAGEPSDINLSFRSLPEGVRSEEELLEKADCEDPWTQCREGAPGTTATENSPAASRSNGLPEIIIAKSIDGLKHKPVARKRLSWVRWIVLSGAFMLFVLMLLGAARLQPKGTPTTVATGHAPTNSPSPLQAAPPVAIPMPPARNGNELDVPAAQPAPPIAIQTMKPVILDPPPPDNQSVPNGAG